MPARNPRYPVPDRSGQAIDRKKGADGVLDLGWCDGVLSDGRPFRAELWAQDQISILTFFFSVLGLEALSHAGVYALVEREGLVRPVPGKRPSFQVSRWTDPHGHAFWSANVTVGTDEETYLADSVAVVRYAPDGQNPGFRRG